MAGQPNEQTAASSVSDTELHSLRRAFSDVAALSSLPAMWLNANEHQIAERLSDALMHVLKLEAVQIEASLGPDNIISVGRVSAGAPGDIKRLLREAFQRPGTNASARELLPNTTLRGFCVGIGLTEGARLCAAASRADFPSQAEQLELFMVANQAAVAWQRAGVERALRQSEAELRELNATLAARVEEQSRERDRIWRNSRDLHVVTDNAGTFLAVNPAWELILGHHPEEVIGHNFQDFIWPDDTELTRNALEVAASGAPLTNFENRYKHKDGTPRWISWHTTSEGAQIYAYGRDATAEKAQAAALLEAEEHVRQSQKMEAIGQLTGGVAHDFNNLLTIIRGATDLLRRPGLSEEKRQRYVGAISETSDRAAKLTGQLLAFARRQSLSPCVFDVRERLEDVRDVLKTVLGSRIVLNMELDSSPAIVEADTSQFETALINLAANARDAMNNEGTVTLAIEHVNLRPIAGKRRSNSVPGIAISMTDSGCGIASDQLARIFEPFFTTKEIGKGTGLGLSQVYGFARQSGGEITVDSEVGRGAKFTLILPSSTKAIVPSSKEEPLAHVTSQQGCILVVEDNMEVGNFSSLLLNDLGFHTVLASSGEEALKLLEENPGRFDLVFSDVVMPGMGGIALGHEVRRRLPTLPFVLTSGYSHVLAEGGTKAFELLHKPYSVESLARVLRRAKGPEELKLNPIAEALHAGQQHGGATPAPLC